MRTKTIITVFRLSLQERQALKELATAENLDLSTVTRRALRDTFQQAAASGLIKPETFSALQQTQL